MADEAMWEVMGMRRRDIMECRGDCRSREMCETMMGVVVKPGWSWSLRTDHFRKSPGLSRDSLPRQILHFTRSRLTQSIFVF